MQKMTIFSLHYEDTNVTFIFLCVLLYLCRRYHHWKNRFVAGKDSCNLDSICDSATSHRILTPKNMVLVRDMLHNCTKHIRFSSEAFSIVLCRWSNILTAKALNSLTPYPALEATMISLSFIM